MIEADCLVICKGCDFFEDENEIQCFEMNVKCKNDKKQYKNIILSLMIWIANEYGCIYFRLSEP